MSKKRDVSVIVDAKNKSKGAFLEVKKDLRSLGDESQKGLSKFSKSFADADKVIFSFADRMKWMDKLAKRTFQGTAAAAGVYIGATLRDFAQLNNGISKVNTLYDQTADSQRKMYQDSIKMFSLIPTNFEKITQGIYDTISAGADPKNATTFARKFGMAGVAGDADMDVVTKAAMGTMNAFKLEARDLTKILDLQFMTVKDGITSYSELASSLGTGVLASAKSSGITLEELYGSIAMITKNAIPANIATTSLNQMFNKFTDTKAIKEFKKFGVEIQDAKKNTRPLIEILKDLYEQFDKKKMTSEERKGYLKKILGSDEAARAILPLLSDLKEFQKILNDMDNSSGAMKDAFGDRLESMSTQFKLFWNQIKGMGLEQLLTLEPLLNSILEPWIKRTKLELEIADLQDSLELTENPHTKQLIRLEIEDLEKQLSSMDLTPVEKFRDSLDESVKALEKINPPLAQFLDTIGNFVLNFVGEEGAENREKAGNVAKGVVGVYAFKKTIDVMAWMSKNFKWIGELFKKDGNKSPEETLVKTLQTMNVNANVVNVYGNSINNMSGGFPGGRVPPIPPVLPNFIPSKPLTPLPSNNPIPLPSNNPIPLPPGGSEVIIVDTAAGSGTAIASATGAILSGLPVLTAALIALAQEKKKNDESKKILENPENYTYSSTKNKWVTKEEMAELNKEQMEKDRKNNVTIGPSTVDLRPAFPSKNKSANTPSIDQIKAVENLMNTKLMDELLKINQLQDKINNISMQNQVTVEPPQVDVNTKVYIDGKSIPTQKVEVDYRKMEKQLEVQARRYGRPDM
ncbi:phage tail tape measure protein [Tissierella praeacuta]|uniref:phage tail tape measure protein n=1 Tax=Tissierella praeacuta TaxID=43131 RepID=UPI003DA582FE